MGISWTNLGLIIPNPYQTRDHEDPEHVTVLAESIRAHGLMQFPVAREFEGMYQLAFGHSRFAAYKQLYMEKQDDQWLQMPIIVQQLTDLQMFEYAVSENLDRKDLTPIETAKAMLVYQNDFHKTSEEVGKLFHLGGSAVRNKLRLLGLPEDVQEKVGSGQVSEGTARKLLSLAVVAPAERVTAITNQLASAGPVSESYVNSQVMTIMRQTAYEMWGGYNTTGEIPCGGAGLWPLTWTPGVLESSRRKVEEMFETRGLMNLGDDLFLATWWPAQTGGDIEAILKDGHYPAEQCEPAAQLLVCLANPPACTNCPLHTVLDGTHFCGFKNCWDRKRKAWYQAELDRLVKSMGIPAYDKETDGPLFEEAGSYYSTIDRDKYQKWVDDKADHLRLKIRYEQYSTHLYTDSHCIEVISIRKEAIKKIEAEKKKESHRDEESRNQQERWKLERENRDASDRFIDNVAAYALTSPITVVDNLGFFEWMIRNDREEELEYKNPKATREDKLQACRHNLMDRWLKNKIGYSVTNEGPVAVAKHLQGVAKSWGVELPENWLDIAVQFAPGFKAQEPLPEPAEKVPAEVES